jgi:hypothetical protein
MVQCVSYQIIYSKIFGLFQSGADHSPVLGSDILQEPSMGQGLSNEFKFVKISRLESEIWVDKKIASKWKIYIYKLKPVKDIERLIIIIKIKIIIIKMESDLFYGKIYWTKLSFPHSEYGRYPWDSNFKILSEPLSFQYNLLNKKAIRSILRWNLLNKTE